MCVLKHKYGATQSRATSRSTRGSHSHAGIMNVYAYLVTSTCNTTMYIPVQVFVLQFTVFAVYMFMLKTYTYKVANRFDHTHIKSLPPQHFRQHGSCSTDSCSASPIGHWRLRFFFSLSFFLISHETPFDTFCGTCPKKKAPGNKNPAMF